MHKLNSMARNERQALSSINKASDALHNIIKLCIEKKDIETFGNVCHRAKTKAADTRLKAYISGFYNQVRLYHQIFESTSLFCQTDDDNLLFELPDPKIDKYAVDLWVTVRKQDKVVKFGLVLQSAVFSRMIVNYRSDKDFKSDLLEQSKEVAEDKNMVNAQRYIEKLQRKMAKTNRRCYEVSRQLKIPVRPAFFFIKKGIKSVDMYGYFDQLRSFKLIRFR